MRKDRSTNSCSSVCRSSRGVVATAVMFTLCVLPASTPAQQRSLGTQASPIRFHRAFVPSEIIRKSSNYLPMKQTEFADRIRKANSKSGNTTKPFIESATYACKASDGSLVDGTATLELAIPDKKACTLTLDPVNIAVEEATWLAGGRAKLGKASDGTRLIIPQSIAESGHAVLSMKWTLAGTVDAFDSAEFDLGLPRAIKTRLEVASERSIEVTSSRGLVHKSEKTPLANDAMIAPALHKWIVELGGIASCQLVISPERAPTDNTQVVYRQTTDYSVSLAGTEIETRIFVRKSTQPIRRFTLVTSADTQLKSVDWNGASLPWRSSSATYLGRQFVTIVVPPFENLNVDVLTINATAPVNLGSLSALPTIRPQLMHWRSATAQVSISNDLKLKNYELRGFQQVRSRNANSVQLRINAESANAAVALHLESASNTIQIANGISVNIARDSISAESIVELRNPPANWHRLVALVHEGWTVEDVTADDSDLIGDWEIITADDLRLLEIEVRPRVPGTSAMLRIRAARPLGETATTMSQADVTPLTFRDVDYEYDVRCLRSAEGVRLELDTSIGGAESESVNVRSNLITKRPGDLVYPLTQKSASAAIRLKVATPRFTANTNVVLRVDDATVSEEFEIQWIPQDSKIERALVHLSQPRNVPPQWTFVEPAPHEIVARRLAQDEQERANLGTTGETWQFVMQDLGTERRTIRGFREFTPDDLDNILPSLIMLPAARSQRATLRLENESSKEYRITASEVEATFIPSDSGASQDATIGSFRYSPERDAVNAATPVRLIRSKADSDKALVNCWAWTAGLDSHFSPDGTAQHRFTYRIENHGRRTIEFKANEDLQIRRITVGDSVIVPDEDQSNAVRAELPRNDSDILVVVDASSKQKAWGFTKDLTVDFLSLDVPVVQSQWTVWLPDEYQPFSMGRRIRRQSVPWTAQVFGWAGQHSQRLGNWLAARHLVDSARLTPNLSVNQFYAALSGATKEVPRFGQQRTWGEVLSAIATNNSESRILIDQRALRQVGITPETPFSVDVSRRADETLTVKGVILVLTENGLLLSTNQRRGLWAESFSETIWPGVFQLRTGPLLSKLENTWEFPIAQVWSKGLGTFNLQAESMAPHQTIASQRSLNAWHVNLNGGNDDQHGKLRVVRKQVSQVAGWLCFAVSLTLVWRTKPYIPCLSGGMLLAGILTLFSAGAVQPIALGLMFGTVLGFFLRHLTQAISRNENEIASGSTIVRSTYKPFSGLSTIPVWVLILVSFATVLAMSHTNALGQFETTQFETSRVTDENETRNSAADSTAKSHAVLIPVDQEQEPIGDYLFLPKTFYHRLFKLDRPKTPTADWLFRGARYDGRMASQTLPAVASSPITLDELSVTYEIETFPYNVSVPIPLPKNVLDTGPSAVRLDGRNVRPINSVSGSTEIQDALFVRVALPGVHEIRLKLRPRAAMDQSGTSLRLKIPKIPQSTVTIEAPKQVDIQFPSAIGTTQRSDNGKLDCQLGPADSLAIGWQPKLSANQSNVSVRLTSLLDPQLDQAFLRTKISLQGEEATGLRRTVDLSFDKSIQWLPSGNSPSVRIVDTGSGKQRLRVALNRQGTTDEPIQFLLKSPSRTLQIPSLVVDSVGATEHWLGVQTENEVSVTYPESAENVSLPLFEESWGDDSVEIQEAFRVDVADGGWSIGLSRDDSSLSCDEVTEVLVGGSTATIQYQSQVRAVRGEHYKHALQTPDSLTVREVKVLKEDRELDAIWNQNAGETIVFAREPLTGAYRIELQAEMSVDTNESQPMPLIWLDNATTTNHSLRLFRAPRTAVSIENIEGFRETQELAAMDVAKGAWRVAELQTNSPQTATATITAETTAPQLNGRMLTQVSRDESGWKARAKYSLDVSEGSVGLVVIGLPESWRETLAVTPEIPFTTVDVDGGDRALQLWFEEPRTGTVQFEILGALDITESVSVPELRPANVTTLECIVQVPASTLNERLKWSTSSLTLLIGEDALAYPSPAENTEYTTYRAKPGFRAELDFTEPRENLPHVSLTEVNHVIGRLVDYGVATYHIEPSGDPSTVLTIPVASVLLDASVGGLPAQVQRLDANRYQVNLGATRLPHRLRVAYQMPHRPRKAAKWTLTSPVLDLSSNGRILWTISTLDDTNQTHEVVGRRALPRLEFALERVASLRRLFEAPDVVSIDYSNPEVTGWYRHWKYYFAKRIENARSLLAVNESRVTASELAKGHTTISETESRLRLVEQQLVGLSADLSPNIASMPSAPPLATQFGSSTEFFSTGPGITSVEIQSSTIGQFEYVHRLIAAALMLTMGCVLAFGSDSEQWENWLIKRWPFLLCGLGIIWWFALYPQWLGVVLFALGLFCAFTLKRIPTSHNS